MKKINPERIAALRSKLGLSQKELAGRVSVDVGTISRWERGEIGRIRQGVFGKLAVALAAADEDLCGDGPLPERQSEQQEPKKGQMNLSINSACRNALTLVARRYHVSRQEIVEAAPLMFLIMAEQCLRQRRQQLGKLRAAETAVYDATPSHLPTSAAVDDSIATSEQRSIEERDLFGEKVLELASDEDGERNPFALFLTAALSSLSDSKNAVHWSSGFGPKYRICADAAADIVGGDAEAAEAVLSGVAALHEMPTEVRKSPHERAKWAKWAMSENDKKLQELIAELGLPSETNKGESHPTAPNDGASL